MVTAATRRSIFNKLQPISKGRRSKAISRVKVPMHQWHYSPDSKELYQYSKGAFYTHLANLDAGDNLSFRRHYARKLLPKSGCIPARVTAQTCGYSITAVDYDSLEIWKEVSELEEMDRFSLKWNADYLRHARTDGTPFASGPLGELFGLYRTCETTDAVLRGNST